MKKFVKKLINRTSFNSDFRKFKKLDLNKKLPINKSDNYPCLTDKTEITDFDAHYIYHPAWAARIVKEISPQKHIDISSTLNFCAILSAFIPTEFYDFRPAILDLDNLYSGKADLNNLFFKTDSIESISCMHTIEHIGLGRYGDPIDPDGDIKAINEIIRVVKPGGSILFVTPVGKPKIMFNAHRIYNPSMVIKLFNGCLLNQFTLLTDDNRFIYNADIELGNQQNYGCGCFWFIKNSH